MRRLGFVVAAAMVLSAHSASGAGGGSSEASPSSVLRKVDPKLGQQSVNFAPRGEAAGPDRTLAPYFYVAGGDSEHRAAAAQGDLGRRATSPASSRT